MCFPPCSADPGVKGWLLPREVLRTNPSPVLDGNDFFFLRRRRKVSSGRGQGRAGGEGENLKMDAVLDLMTLRS